MWGASLSFAAWSPACLRGGRPGSWGQAWRAAAGRRGGSGKTNPRPRLSLLVSGAAGPKPHRVGGLKQQKFLLTVCRRDRRPRSRCGRTVEVESRRQGGGEAFRQNTWAPWQKGLACPAPPAPGTPLTNRHRIAAFLEEKRRVWRSRCLPAPCHRSSSEVIFLKGGRGGKAFY